MDPGGKKKYPFSASKLRTFLEFRYSSRNTRIGSNSELRRALTNERKIRVGVSDGFKTFFFPINCNHLNRT